MGGENERAFNRHCLTLCSPMMGPFTSHFRYPPLTKGKRMKLKIEGMDAMEERLDKLLLSITTALCVLAITAGLFLLGMMANAH
jgi:hypothetical protein